MKKFIIQSTVLLVVTFTALFLFFNQQYLENFIPTDNTPPETNTGSRLKVGNTTVNIEIADTPSKRGRGLSNRVSLPQDSGMLFIFEAPTRPKFWMKELNFPLDFIWIKEGRVVEIMANVPNPVPGTLDSELAIYQPAIEIDQVLEVNAGFIKKNNIMVGDRVNQI